MKLRGRASKVSPEEVNEMARAAFFRRFRHHLVMTDNELEECLKKAPSVLILMKALKRRSDMNSESIHSAIVSYGKY